ncbi:MAG: endonuclease III [Candidatus Entotheonellia bacterium]
MARSPAARTSGKETASHKRARLQDLLARLEAAYPDARCSLMYSTPLELLVATILSAQCTDARVNVVTRSLFTKYRTARDYAEAPEGELEEDIRSTGFYRNKARALRACCAALVERHAGEVPAEMGALVELPGIGRKTANVILGNAFNQAEGIVVDTHVRRIAQRLGLTAYDDPEKIEQDLVALVPRRAWIAFGHLLIEHGRKLCQARAPKCPACPLCDLCPAAQR